MSGTLFACRVLDDLGSSPLRIATRSNQPMDPHLHRSLPTLRRGWVSDRSGLTSPSLLHVIHDLRSSLNTLGILAEVVRAQSAGQSVSAAESAAGLARIVQGLGAMLDRLANVSDAIAPVLEPVPLRPAVQGAVEQWRASTKLAGVSVDSSMSGSEDLVAHSCRRRLEHTLTALFHCVASALPEGGSLRLRLEAGSDTTGVAVECSGPVLRLPPKDMAWKLTSSPSSGPDWFEVCARVSGLGGELRFDPGDQATVVVVLPAAHAEAETP